MIQKTSWTEKIDTKETNNTDIHNFCFLMYIINDFNVFFIADKFKNRILLSPTDF
jgi:hypothetical protein